MIELDPVLDALRRGLPVVIPTDTVHGIAAVPSQSDAISKIFDLKRRSEDKPLPVLGSSRPALEEVVSFDRRAVRIADEYWPGPLTLVLPRTSTFAADLGGESSGGVAVRVPALDRALELLRRSGPLAVTSANRSGKAPATTVEEARAMFGDAVAAYLDGGRCAGDPSTVVSLVGEPIVLREGPLQAARLLPIR